MSSYRFQEGRLEVPAEFREQSIQSFTRMVEDTHKRAINMTITRDFESDKQAPVEYGDEQLVEAAKTFPRFKLLKRSEWQLHGQHTVENYFTWVPPKHRPVLQRQTYLHLPTHERGPCFLVLTLTYNQKDAQLAEGHWGVFLASFALELSAGAPGA